MVREILGKKVTWLITIGAIAMAIAMGAGYLGAFLNPEEHIHDFPIGIVNEDAGVSFLGQSQNKGNDAIAAITAEDPARGDAIAWLPFDSRADLVAAMQRNELYGGLVIPEDFTRDLASIAQPQTAGGESQAATIEVLFNNGAGSLPSAQGKEIVRQAANAVNSRASGELLRSLQSSGASVKPTMIPLISNPVVITETDLIPAGAHTDHGMGAFYIAVVTTIGGFLAANIVSVGIDFVTGHGTMGPAMARLRGGVVPSNLYDMFKVKLILLAVSTVISAAVVTWLTTSVWGTPASSVWGLFGLILLGMFSIGALTLFFIALLGTPGVLVSLLFTTILGIPSAAGIFPYEMLPRFYQVLSEVMPVRFLSDAVRSMVFFDGQRDTGLTTGVWVLVAYGAVSTLLGALVSLWMARQRESKASDVEIDPVVTA